MSKRRLNAFDDCKDAEQDVDSDISYSENEYDSENDVAYQPVCKKMYKCNNDSNGNLHNSKGNKTSLPTENYEHAYSCYPVFNNGRAAKNKNYSDYSSESDETNLNTRKISERSTSSESLKCKGKSVDVALNSQNSKSKRRPKCFNKNAVMARMNRQRKKEYVTKLEENVANLKESNVNLTSKLNEQQEQINSLKNEIKYLKSVLSNSKEIGSLLCKIKSDDDSLKITSSILGFQSPQNDSLFNDEIKDENELDWLSPPCYEASEMDKMFQCDLPSELNDAESINQFGVCLHVANKQVSLEFCATCSRNASSVLNNDVSSSVK